MSKNIRDELVDELIKFAEQLKRHPDKASWVMQAVTAIREGRRDMDTALELDIYAKIDAEAGLYREAELLGRATSALRAIGPSLPPLPPPRRALIRPRSR